MVGGRRGQHLGILRIVKIRPYGIRGPYSMSLDVLDGNIVAELQGGPTPSEGVETLIPWVQPQ